MKTRATLLFLVLVFGLLISGCAWVCCVGKDADTDADGVLNSMDKCENTPLGVVVYRNGCPIDTDGDFVPDFVDKCPDTPMTVKMVDKQGCPPDADGDGVLDYMDDCPDTPRNLTVDATGCVMDTDGDGVPDYTDNCPATPKATYVDENGCPRTPEKPLVLNDTHFDFDSATIRDDAKRILDEALEDLKDDSLVKLRIEGHTDSTGSEQYNLGLSQGRAKAVRDYLVSKGVAPQRIEVLGKGERLPVATNETREGRSKNRRAEFVIISQ